MHKDTKIWCEFGIKLYRIHLCLPTCFLHTILILRYQHERKKKLRYAHTYTTCKSKKKRKSNVSKDVIAKRILIWAYKTVAEDGLFYLNMNFYISMIALITNSKLRVHFYDIEFIWCDRINSSHAKLDHATVGIRCVCLMRMRIRFKWSVLS